MALTTVSSGMIANTGVTAGVYGNSGNIVSITVNSEGQITAASNVAVSIPSGAYADSNNVILINNTVITSNTTIAAGKGAFSVGPVSVAIGNTVSIGSGSRWVIL
jgi:carbonic anhydrase/acetyltransferase-like protein (isoleucine patch superfamily)